MNQQQFELIKSIASLYIALASVDEDLDDNEIQTLFEKISEWVPEIEPELLQKIVLDVNTSSHDLDWDYVFKNINSNLDDNQKSNIIKDLVSISIADSEVADEEIQVIQMIIKGLELSSKFDLEEYFQYLLNDSTESEQDNASDDELPDSNMIDFPIYSINSSQYGSLNQNEIKNYFSRWMTKSVTFANRIGFTAFLPNWITVSLADEFCPIWEEDKIDLINDAILNNKIIPILNYLLPLKDDIEDPWWFIPMCIWKDDTISWVAVDKNGIYGAYTNSDAIDFIVSWNDVDHMDFEYNASSFMNSEDDNNINSLIIYYDQNEENLISFNEFTDENRGSYLSVIASIYQVRKETIEASKDKPIWLEGAGGEGFQLINKPKELLNLGKGNIDRPNFKEQLSASSDDEDYNNDDEPNLSFQTYSNQGSSGVEEVDQFLSKLNEIFPDLKQAKGKKYSHERYPKGCLFAVNVLYGKIGVEFVSGGKLDVEKVKNFVNETGITKSKLFGKYEVIAKHGERNKTHYRIDAFIPFDDIEEILSENFINETQKVYNKLKELFEDVPNKLG